jgi:hypothetical protein
MSDPTGLNDQDYEALLDAAAKIHGIVIRPEWREAAILNLKITGDAAAFVQAFALSDEAEPAPIFIA